MIEVNNTCTCDTDWFIISNSTNSYCVYCGPDKYLYNAE